MIALLHASLPSVSFTQLQIIKSSPEVLQLQTLIIPQSLPQSLQQFNIIIIIISWMIYLFYSIIRLLMVALLHASHPPVFFTWPQINQRRSLATSDPNYFTTTCLITPKY